MAQSLTTAWTGLPFSLSSTQITNIINHVDYTPTILSRFKLLTTKGWTPYVIKDPDTGQVLTGPYGDNGDITKWVDTASMSSDTTQKSHRTLDITFKGGSTSFAFNVFTDAIQVFIGYWTGNPIEGGTFLFEVPLGMFLFTLPDTVFADSGQISHALMSDYAIRAINLNFMNSYVIPQGVDFISAATGLLTQDPVPLSLGGKGFTPTGSMDCPGPGVYPTRVSVDSLTHAAQTALTPAPIAFTRDQNFFDAAAQMLDAIGYYPPWFDGMGICRFTPRPNLSLAVPNPTWKFHTDASSIIFPGVQWKPVNWDKLANAITYYCENSNTASFSATVFNANNGGISDIAIDVIGYTIYKAIKDNKIPDQATAAERAYIALTTAACLAEQLDFKTKPSPFATDAHEWYDVLINDPQGNPPVSSPNGFEETGWKLDLNNLEHTHTIGKLLVL